jgi:Gamma-glutamyl cyclotransferase, AIG2-like
MQHQVWAFFYGTIMNPVAMKEFGVTAATVAPAKVAGFDLTIRPRPNVIRCERSAVFGSLMLLTHTDLAGIYSSLDQRFGVKYVPQAVLATMLDGSARPALCYVAPHMADAPPDPAFVKQLAECVRTMGHPEWYASDVESANDYTLTKASDR